MLYQEHTARLFSGPLHTDDFVMIFCSAPDCMNFCEIIDPFMPDAAFKCRACNPVARVERRWWKIQPNQFDKHLGGHAPVDAAPTPAATSEGRISKRNAKSELRKFLDSKDSMLADGHQINKDRTVERECPEWMCNRFEFLNFLVETCPKMLDETNLNYRKHRNKAALWGGVMYYYHRMGLPASYVADLLSVRKERELSDGTVNIIGERLVTEAQVERIVHAINKRRKRLRVDGTKLNGRRGRPRVEKTTLDLEQVIEVFDTKEDS
jgi:hypothetical protein